MNGVCACGCGMVVNPRREYVHGHNRRGSIPHNLGQAPDLSRYSIEDRGYGTPCWIWTGRVADTGYGRIEHRGVNTGAHKLSFLEAGGQIPDGYVLDHLCRNRACINPAHLEPVTVKENNLRGDGFAGRNARKTHCKHGHEFTPQNTIPWGVNGRACRECRRVRDRVRDASRTRSRGRAAA